MFPEKSSIFEMVFSSNIILNYDKLRFFTISKWRYFTRDFTTWLCHVTLPLIRVKYHSDLKEGGLEPNTLINLE